MECFKNQIKSVFSKHVECSGIGSRSVDVHPCAWTDVNPFALSRLKTGIRSEPLVYARGSCTSVILTMNYAITEIERKPMTLTDFLVVFFVFYSSAVAGMFISSIVTFLAFVTGVLGWMTILNHLYPAMQWLIFLAGCVAILVCKIVSLTEPYDKPESFGKPIYIFMGASVFLMLLQIILASIEGG